MKRVKYPGLGRLTILNLLVWMPIIWICVSACDNTNVPTSKTDDIIGLSEIHIYDIEGCEYLGPAHIDHDAWLTHKGDCKNPIHQNQCK